MHGRVRRQVAEVGGDELGLGRQRRGAVLGKLRPKVIRAERVGGDGLGLLGFDEGLRVGRRNVAGVAAGAAERREEVDACRPPQRHAVAAGAVERREEKGAERRDARVQLLRTVADVRQLHNMEVKKGFQRRCGRRRWLVLNPRPQLVQVRA